MEAAPNLEKGCGVEQRGLGECSWNKEFANKASLCRVTNNVENEGNKTRYCVESPFNVVSNEILISI